MYTKVTQKQIENYLAEIALRNINTNPTERRIKIWATRKAWEGFDKAMKETVRKNYEK